MQTAYPVPLSSLGVSSTAIPERSISLQDCFNKIAHRRSRRPLGLGTSNNTDQPIVEWFYAKVARKLACMVANDLAVLVLILFFFSFLSFAFSRSTTRGHPRRRMRQRPRTEASPVHSLLMSEAELTFIDATHRREGGRREGCGHYVRLRSVHAPIAQRSGFLQSINRFADQRRSSFSVSGLLSPTFDH